MDRIYKFLTLIALNISVLVFAGDKIYEGSIIRVHVTQPEKSNKDQVVKFDSGQLSKYIDDELEKSGYNTHGVNSGFELSVKVMEYDSGKYFGFAKTAYVRVNFTLIRPDGSIEKVWDLECTHRSSFNLQSTETRNASAVQACFAEIAQGAAADIVDM